MAMQSRRSGTAKAVELGSPKPSRPFDVACRGLSLGAAGAVLLHAGPGTRLPVELQA